MKKIAFLILFIASVSLLISANGENSTYAKYHFDGIKEVYFSSNPPAGKTGAPGEGLCTQCHSGSTYSADGNVNLNFSAIGEYKLDSTYSLTIDAINGPKNGFQITILDDNNQAAGTFNAGTGTSVVSQNGKNYIRQTASAGVTSWDFEWTAPSTDQGSLTAYYTVNKSNGNGNTSGDSIFIGQQSIYYSSDLIDVSDINTHQQLKRDFDVYYNSGSKYLGVKFDLMEQYNVQVQIRSMNGQLVRMVDYGQLNAHQHKKQIDLSDIGAEGIYLVTVFIDNYILTEKVYIN